MRYFSVLILFVAYTLNIKAQPCTALGQKPTTAFPVCGIDTFSQTTVPYCNNSDISVPGCGGVAYSDKNPFWYKITCYQSGSLVFQITPNSNDEDYDWQIFDITGHNPDEVYAGAGLVVVGNWAGTYGVTGTSETAAHLLECASDPAAGVPTFSTAPQLQQGHTYLLMVSHYSDSPNGYALSFGGGTAVITDPKEPALQGATASCDGSQITVRFNKSMKCNSLAANGSDFTIPGSGSNVISAMGVGCSDGFDMDTVILTLDKPLLPGNYNVEVHFGDDSNSVTDNCDRNIPAGDTISFSVFLRQPTPLDSLTPPGCATDQVQLVFRKNIRCSSIAVNGSDFSITGTYPVSVASASGVCNAGLTNVINIKTSRPLYSAGTFTVSLRTGLDSSTIIDECGEETPAGATLSFSVKDTVNASFTPDLRRGCKTDTLYLFHNGNNGITKWNWLFDTSQSSTDQNPSTIYKIFGNKSVQLIVSNDFCSDTASWNFNLEHDSLQATISGPGFYCPNELVTFRDSSIGNIINWYWSFGNGNTSNQQYPALQSYKLVGRETFYPVQLVVQSDKNCFDTTVRFVRAVANCSIAVPSAFTPNHDALNDYLYPLNAYKATNLNFRVYNKYGQMIYETKDWAQKWDGSVRGHDQPSGVYVWILEYTDEYGKRIFQKGTSVLIR